MVCCFWFVNVIFLVVVIGGLFLSSLLLLFGVVGAVVDYVSEWVKPKRQMIQYTTWVWCGRVFVEILCQHIGQCIHSRNSFTLYCLHVLTIYRHTDQKRQLEECAVLYSEAVTSKLVYSIDKYTHIYSSVAVCGDHFVNLWTYDK